MSAFLVRDNHIFNGPHSRSLCLFARTAHSAMLSYAPLAHSVMGSLTHYYHSLMGELKFMNVFTLKTHLAGMNVFFSFTRNTPHVHPVDSPTDMQPRQIHYHLALHSISESMHSCGVSVAPDDFVFVLGVVVLMQIFLAFCVVFVGTDSVVDSFVSVSFSRFRFLEETI